MTALAASPIRVALLVAGALAALVGARLVASDGDFTRFAVAGTDFTDPSRTPVPVAVIPGSGYDGQFQLRLAFDPWPDAEVADGIALAPPAYRHQRILHPLLSFALSGGSAPLAPAALVLVNALAVVAIAGSLAALARRRGLAPAHALVPALYFGFSLSVGRDLSEPVAAAAVGLAAVASLGGRSALAAALLSLAVLARETSVITALGFALASTATARRGERIAAAGVAALPLAVFAGWQALLLAHWGSLPIASGGGLGLPGVGLAQGLLSTARDSGPLEALVWTAEVAWLAALCVALVRPVHSALASTPTEAGDEARVATARWLAWAWLAQAALLACAPAYVWADDWSFSRVCGEWVVLGCALATLSGSPPGRWLGASGLALWLVTAARLALRP